MELINLLCRTIRLLLSVEEWALLLRMLLPFFMDEEESTLCLFLAAITEPFIVPVRELLVLLNVGQDSPVDWAFSLTYILIWCAQLFLPAL